MNEQRHRFHVHSYIRLLLLFQFQLVAHQAIINGSEFVIRNGISFVLKNKNIIGPTTKPIRKKKLSPLPCFEVRRLSVILLMPASRPLPTKNTTTAKPIIIPPAKADKGVKFIIFMSISPYIYEV
tara:strand:+ start:99 stop:473 length:375 start_codon:yes stop_codon:yes gene_type:complete